VNAPICQEPGRARAGRSAPGGSRARSRTATGPVAHLPPWVNGDIQTLIKAYWNMTLLSYDETLGIHNPQFFNDVVANSSARLELARSAQVERCHEAGPCRAATHYSGSSSRRP